MHKLIMRLGVVCVILMAFFVLPSLANAQGAFLYNIKGSTGFSQPDLQGIWQFSDGRVYGSVTLDESGNILSGSVTVPEEDLPIDFEGGALLITAAGEITGEIDLEGGDTVTFNTGRMDQGRNLFVAIEDSPEDAGAVFFIKSGGQTS
ncbi:MAG: hypothetical protein JRI95_04620, partial [Deltaproteobacteria bacterium]|nr:hypothetical protein [Deltaproteobacteria bacterium]